MDNDVQGTEYCIGFSTAITRASELVTRRRTILGSHERIGVFRIFGRDAGFTSLYTAYVAGTRSLIPEYPFDLDKLIELLISDKKVNPSRYSIAIISEGAVWTGREIGEEGEADAYGHKKKVDIGQALADEIQRRTGQETLVNDLTYDVRGGAPDVIDQMVATTYGNIAMDLLSDGVAGQMVGVKNGCYAHMDIPSHSLGPRKVDVSKLYDTERYRPNFTGKVGTPFFLTRA
jgi:6-phosphofructokinase 1